MTNKYIILDEIKLELLKTKDGSVRMFQFREMAIDWAEYHCKAWQVIEIPFGDC